MTGQSDSKFLLESVLEYVKNERANYGLMINGEWGSGKTYFWDNVLSPKIESINGKPLKTVYVSLYGVSTTEEISKRICYEVYASALKKKGHLKKLIDSKVGNALPELSKVILNFGGKQMGIDPIGSSSIDWDKLYSLKNKVLCFDDLERANLEVSEILGYINNFVEHDGVKTIIICNEKEVNSKVYSENNELKKLTATYLLNIEGKLGEKEDTKSRQSELKQSTNQIIDDTIQMLFSKSNDYKHIKEKLIGKTLLYSSNENDIINNIISINEHYKSYDYILTGSDIIIEIFQKSKTKNFRILIQAIDDFERIFQKLKSDYPVIDQGIVKSIFIFTLILSFEIKSGKLPNKELLEINSDLDFQQRIIMDKMDKKSSYITSLLSTYRGVHTESGIVFFQFVKELVVDGILNTEFFKVEIDKQVKDKERKEVPGYVKIIKQGYWELTNDDFNVAVADSYEAIKSGKMSIRFYFSGFIVFLKLMELELINEDITSLKELFINGLEKIVEKANIEDIETSFTRFGKPTNYEDDINEIKQKIIETRKKLEVKEDEHIANELLESLKNNIQEYYFAVDRKHWNKPLFEHLDMNDVARIILIKSNKDINLFANILFEHYKEMSEALKPDLPKLDELQAILINHVSEELAQNRNSLTVANLKEIVEVISIIKTANADSETPNP